jgi:hypothetical protein
VTGPLTDQVETVANYILAAIDGNKANFPTPVIDTFYGDQELLPHTPAICVIPSVKTREFQGASLMTLNIFEIMVMVYFDKVTDVQQNLHSCATLSDAVETFIHGDLTLGGNVTSVLCTQSELGITTRQGALMVAARQMYRAQSKTRFPAQR